MVVLHFFNPFATQNKKTFQKSLLPWLPELFLYAHFSPFFLLKNNYFWTKSSIFFRQSMGTQNANFTHFYFILLLHKTKTKTISKKFAPLTARATLYASVSPFLIKNDNFLQNRQYFSGKA